ncbi:MAG TPA: anaerobic ribonucleoside-triphosphate reductase [Acidobacteriota bacterium]|nr:anaerobic ribonucleoside-triphosphate reductase [Acidobacteriota bacterium]HMZ80375.1 anaerobic ribonucleoside-triphosphate reductase [Acidobacteriota bacterium]HNB71118.1 anaerobic ribonucleoside-triphosphate reductase [Acidobacteriota bacterium]HNG95512.1 anaerobic ribonucleoside-triphosphate reductase [Acidobacteriota bacterium]HNJ40470.1 anaerobic ribonucleoside-triphosphate reductase [Acidobacteriota bacterium]
MVDETLSPVSFTSTAAASGPTEYSPELDLLVRHSDERIVRFDRRRIVTTLIRETGLKPELADKISYEIQAMLSRAGVTKVSSSLIQSLVDARLIEHGLEREFVAHSRLGIPRYELDQIIHQSARAEHTQPLGPEGTSLRLAEAIKREYAILSVFSEPVAKAHLIGDIYIQNLGGVDRPRLLVQSLDSIKRYGITLPQSFANWRPARHPEVLVAHLVKFSAALQGYINGPIEWDAVNYCLAPYVEDLDAKSLKQLAQGLLFELSSPSAARGGQMLTCTLHLDWEVPPYMGDRIAIGPGGESTGRSYRDYSEAAQKLLRAIYEAYLEGDGQKLPFTGAQLVLHIAQHFSESVGYKGLLDTVSQVATGRGGIHIVFDRNNAHSFYRRYGVPLEGALSRADTTEWCTAVFQAVGVNLPRAAYRSGSTNQTAILEELTRLMDVAAQAHLEKRIFLEKLMALGEQGPLALLAMRRQGNTFLRLGRTTHWLCPIGLNELVWAVTGQQLHESQEAREFGKRVIAHIAAETVRLSSRHKTRFLLAECSAEEAPHRLAQLDLQFFPDESAEFVQGQVPTGDVFYSNGVKLNSKIPVSALERAQLEGFLHNDQLINTTSEIWLGSQPVAASTVAVFISQAFYRSQASGLVFAPEFTACLACGAVSHGLQTRCTTCGSAHIDGIAQAGLSYSRTSNMTDSQMIELKNRYRESLKD